MRKMKEAEAADQATIKAKPDHRSVFNRTVITIIDNLVVDLPFLNELKARRVINDHILLDIMTRPNRPQKVICLAEHVIALGPHAMCEFGQAIANHGHESLAEVLYHLYIEERDRAWSQRVPRPDYTADVDATVG